MPEAQNNNSSTRNFDSELARLERLTEELRVQYEQYFIDIVPLPPDKLHAQVKSLIRTLLKAPFKNSADRFRLRTAVQRYKTFETYWTRILKQREEGTYSKDVFKLEMRQKMLEEAERQASELGKAEKGIKQLFNSYQEALKKSGNSQANLEFDSFKKTLLAKARQLKKEHNVTKLNYKIVMKNGKVLIKAQAK
ncbi:MAG: hypothetical protein IT292_04705 [Deltaproteobacteria bacterium]|nr:hypothetical protein [Deltaproteobacteria bacterium]